MTRDQLEAALRQFANTPDPAMGVIVAGIFGVIILWCALMIWVQYRR